MYNKLIYILENSSNLLAYLKIYLQLTKLKHKGNSVNINPNNIELKYPENIIIGDFVIIDHDVTIVAEHSTIEFKSNTKISKNVSIWAQEGANISIGNNTFINQYSHLSAKKNKITIGNNVLIGMDVLLINHNHGFNSLDIPINAQADISKDIFIGDDVWIGAKSVILPGIRVGKSSIIGAGSIVTKDIEPLSIVGGNPARLIKKRM